MNILFFLTPKSDVAFIYSDANLREAIDLMEAHRYSALPILTKQGRYAGTLTEGDLLWYMKSHMNQSLKDMELISVMEVKRRQDNSPVNAGAKMEDLLDKAMQQNFVPVLDDNKSFIGIITRRDIMKYFSGSYKNRKCLSYWIPVQMAFSRLSHKFLSFSSSIIFCRPVILIPSQKKVVRNDESGKERQHPVLDP